MKYTVKQGLKRYVISNKVAEKMFKIVAEYAQFTFPKPHQVSCTVLTIEGTIYPGAEYRSDILTLSMHAEATALAHASIHGEPEIVAITGPNCHACKQLLWENAMRFGNEIIILIKRDTKISRIRLSSMMKYAWPENRWVKNR